MASFVADSPLIVLKCFDLQNSRNVLHDLPFITGLYQIFSKSKLTLDSLNPSKSVQIFSNNALGEKIIEMLSEVYLKALEKFSSPKFGYSIWKLSLLKEKSFLSSSMMGHSMLSGRSMKLRQQKHLLFYLKYPLNFFLYFPKTIFNFISELFGFSEYNFEEEQSKLFEEERVMDRNFQVELFKDQFKDDLKQIASLWGYTEPQTQEIFKNTKYYIEKQRGK